ncbi:MAG TPA: hypothetical protein VFT13_11665 [Candidatus Krumholzibacteria bacterium]|nr:hypothetical protein [Candidatus Krumholzibacteria bacterium]
MTDELTPQEKEAFDKLPRERMPAGLEARVVDAMRERGFLAGRRRTIVLSNARVAGLLAASVAVIIGAYSIGLHRGDGTRVLPPVETVRTNEFIREDAPAVAPELEVEPPAPGLVLQADRTAPEKKRQQVPSPADESRAEEPQMAGRVTEPKQEGEAPAKDAAEVGRDVAESAPTAPAPSVAFEKSALRFERDRAAHPASKTPLTFYLNGTPVIVEAPDSVRVTQDEQGRMLIIYTSDGVIRIRLADDN